MVALDMGKADADVDRQVICVTSIDENVYPKEQIVLAAAIYDKVQMELRTIFSQK